MSEIAGLKSSPAHAQHARWAERLFRKLRYKPKLDLLASEPFDTALVSFISTKEGRLVISTLRLAGPLVILRSPQICLLPLLLLPARSAPSQTPTLPPLRMVTT